MRILPVLSIVSMILLAPRCHQAQSGPKLEQEAFAAKLKQTPEAILIDVRTPQEYDQGFIEQALNIDYKNSGFHTRIGAMDKTRPYFVYCLSGGRSNAAADYMRSHGFSQVYELKGGLLKWTLPLTAPAAAPERKDQLSMQDYHRLVSAGKKVLVDFYAPWCAPCREMEPMLTALADEYKGNVTIVRINIDENQQLTKELGIEEIPVLKIFKEGKEVWTHTGMTDKVTLTAALSAL
jgi:thioredoxin 1